LSAPTLSPRTSPHLPPTSLSVWDRPAILALRKIWESLPPSQDLEAFREEFFSLTQETDPSLLKNEMLNLAARLQSSDQNELAKTIYASFGVEPKIGRTETFLRHFLQDTLSPSTLLSMGVAGLAFRATRFGVLAKLLSNPEASLWTRGLGARVLSEAAGFLAEVPSLTLSAELCRNLTQGGEIPKGQDFGRTLLNSALFLGGAKLGALGSSTFVEQTTFGSGVGSQTLAYAGQLTGILLGQGLEHSLQQTGSGEGTSLLTDSLVTFLQLQISGRLSQAFLGSTWQGWESHLEFATRQLENTNPPRLGLSPAFNGGLVSIPSRGEAESTAKLFFHPFLAEARGEAPASAAQQTIVERFRDEFPVASNSNYTNEILATVGVTPFPKAAWAEALLESLASSPQRGDLSQLFAVDAIRKVFCYDSLNNGGGSFNNTVLQYLLERSLDETGPTKRKNMLRVIAFAMERNPNRTYWTKLTQMANYHLEVEAELIPKYDDFFRKVHFREIQQELHALSPSHRDMVVNFIYELFPKRSVRASALFQAFGNATRRYPREDMEMALDYALRHPLGKLVLRRIAAISAGREPAFKLRDLRPLPQQELTEEEIVHRMEQGWSPEAVAVLINGTYHTAYLTDLRLALKVVRTTWDLRQWQKKPLAWRQFAKQRLRTAIQRFADSSAPLDNGTIWKLLMANGHPLIADAMQSAKYRRFDLEILPDSAFEALLRDCGLSAQSDVAVFVKGNSQYLRDRIAIRDLPASQAPGGAHRPEDIFLRLIATAHELEHWRHFSGNFAPGETGQKAFQFYKGKLGKENRLASEIMASLEEERWQALNSDGPTELSRSAQRLGQSLVFFLRDFNDWSYFGARSKQDLADFLPPLRY